MAQAENTAVNRLVELAGQKPLDVDVDLDDLFVEGTARQARDVARRAVSAPGRTPLPPPFRTAGGTPAPELLSMPPPPARRPSGTQQLNAVPPPVPARPSQQRAAVPPPVPQVAIPDSSTDDLATGPFEIDDDLDAAPTVQATPAPALAPAPTARAAAPAPAPQLPPPVRAEAPRLPAPPVPAASSAAFQGFEDGWFESSHAVVRQDRSEIDQVYVGTEGVARRGRSPAIWYVAAAFTLGLGIAALLFWPGNAAPKAPAAPAAAAVARRRRRPRLRPRSRRRRW
ncbi:MAG: hypothetical protein H6709_05140 [Kofleriaceae bacterium]|nr:hypothetical protein [Kofleriaceae bacterium]